MNRLACAAIAALAIVPAAHATELSIATGGTGGVYFPFGGGLAEVINRHVDGYTASAEVTGAGVENINLLATFETDIGFVLADTASAAFNGTAPFEGLAFPEARTLLAIYPNAVQIVTLADSGITSLEDLRGQRVSVGAPGSGTEVSAQTLLAANGITYDDFDPQRLNFNETADALRDGDIVAGFWSVGPPTSSIMNLAASRAISVLALTEDEIDAAIEMEPTFAPYTLPAGTYDGVDTETSTISTPNALIVHADMDEDLAYNIVRAVLENVDELIAIHPAANDTTVAFTLTASPLPLHPGTIRYLEEIGADIPERLRP
ncbi:TAXI family TRAP transporter solute-binding subunit [Rhodobaculum claviforme]|uniref:C4-dicarboxylate ABC transporter substrate-binding protein n=1 Tax=Rhodobaculum claviforme TaxID=1549854 RepID=A0A934TK89_9RHOB|nr:TAXI family TRAP transporter solute-binding subunit [Rhodobaculum claviforme]MBK5926981.1 C4-dicarboxylate ABC transporter substrate-binding protein [Rhodobaculum claviforme]